MTSLRHRLLQGNRPIKGHCDQTATRNRIALRPITSCQLILWLSFKQSYILKYRNAWKSLWYLCQYMFHNNILTQLLFIKVPRFYNCFTSHVTFPPRPYLPLIRLPHTSLRSSIRYLPQKSLVMWSSLGPALKTNSSPLENKGPKPKRTVVSQ